MWLEWGWKCAAIHRDVSCERQAALKREGFRVVLTASYWKPCYSLSCFLSYRRNLKISQLALTQNIKLYENWAVFSFQSFSRFHSSTVSKWQSTQTKCQVLCLFKRTTCATEHETHIDFCLSLVNNFKSFRYANKNDR